MKLAVNKVVGNPKLLICFMGWASCGRVFDKIDIEGYDIVSLYDYRDEDVPSELFDMVKTYGEISIFAWSFGVFVAEQVVPCLPKIVRSLAVNGTPIPSSAKYGIHPRTLNLTIKNLVLDKFYERMCGDDYSSFVACNRSLEELRDELSCLCAWFGRSDKIAIEWSGVIIGDRDVIFSYQNMLNYWRENSTFVGLDIYNIPHYPFGRLGLEKIKEFYSGR